MEEYYLVLEADVISRLDKSKVYGRGGESITVKFVNLPAVIVENEKGERFPTSIENLKPVRLEIIEEKKEPKVKEKNELQPVKIVKPLPVKKKTKASQSKLF